MPVMSVSCTTDTYNMDSEKNKTVQTDSPNIPGNQRIEDVARGIILFASTCDFMNLCRNQYRNPDMVIL